MILPCEYYMGPKHICDIPQECSQEVFSLKSPQKVDKDS